MVVFISGPDRFRAARFLKEKTEKALADNPGAILLDILPVDLEGNDFAEIIKTLSSHRSLFGERRVVTISGCTSLLSKKDRDDFKELLKKLILSDDHFFVFEASEETLDFFEPQRLKIGLYSFPFLVAKELAVWLQQEVLRFGGRIDRRAAELLAKWRGPETAGLVQELARLVAASGGKTLREADVRFLQEEESGAKTVFYLLNAIESGKLNLALKYFAQAFSSPGDLSYLFSMLSYQLRSLIAGKQGGGFGRYRRSRASVLNTKKLQQLLMALHEADIRWKSGQEDPVVALERYFIRFAKRAA